MRRTKLARQVIAATNAAARKNLLARRPHLADEKLAEEIKSHCYDAWMVDPVQAQRAAAALKSLSKFNKADEIRAFSSWVSGVADITRGRFEHAIVELDKAADLLTSGGRVKDAAQTRVAKLLAAAMLGRYDEAIETGKKALRVFVKDGDDLAAGKIDMNLSNILSRQSRHREAERYCLSARRRFIKAGERGWQAMAENDIANTYAELNIFDKSERYYQMAVVSARAEKMLVTQAEIEANLGNLARLRGRYADALKYLEMSRQKFDGLAMPHQSAIADLEIAGIYHELNLGREAFKIYERITAIFRRLKLRAEEARARLDFGRTALNLGDTATANREVVKAARLFELENNQAGQMSALLSQAAIAIEENDYFLATSILSSSTTSLSRQSSPRQLADRRLLEGRAYLGAGDHITARRMLGQAVALAQKSQYPRAVHSALTLLGNIAVSRGENRQAKAYFSRAIRVIEDLRLSITADEFSMSFLASGLEPYRNMTQLLLKERMFADAFSMVESGRSRSLLSSLDKSATRGASSPKLQRQLAERRAELNFYYKRLDSSTGDETLRIRSETKKTEAAVVDLIRRIDSLAARGANPPRGKRGGVNLKQLQQKLGKTRTLIAYVEFEGKISAFVVDDRSVKFYGDLADASEIKSLLEKMHFQFSALRYGQHMLGRFGDEIKKRSDESLNCLHSLLVRPLEDRLSGDGLVIVPVGSLHYVPFPALRNDTSYLIERFEITTSPSASIWARLQEKPSRRVRNPLLMGYADERIPLVEKEIREIRRGFGQSTVLVGARATFSAFVDNASKFDLIHLACHGQFRPENPMFSNLHLADGWVTVRDICTQKLNAGLVTLSACETGLSNIFAGDEILGLARGFLSAGVSSLVVSLWSVNDAVTGRLMKEFYSSLQSGATVAESLRDTQITFIRRGEHPFFWSPFILIGR